MSMSVMVSAVLVARSRGVALESGHGSNGVHAVRLCKSDEGQGADWRGRLTELSGVRELCCCSAGLNQRRPM